MGLAIAHHGEGEIRRRRTHATGLPMEKPRHGSKHAEGIRGLEDREDEQDRGSWRPLRRQNCISPHDRPHAARCTPVLNITPWLHKCTEVTRCPKPRGNAKAAIRASGTIRAPNSQLNKESDRRARPQAARSRGVWGQGQRVLAQPPPPPQSAWSLGFPPWGD